MPKDRRHPPTGIPERKGYSWRMRGKALFTWSGGKDSAMALYEVRKAGGCDIAALLTTVTQEYGRISMHGVRVPLLEMQAGSIGIPLHKVTISKSSSNEEYESRMREALAVYRDQGVSSVIFGDIFLEDLRRYREENLAKMGLNALFPIWKRDTGALSRAFIDAGFRAVVTCVDSQHLDGTFSGREYDSSFLSDLPAKVDPCGENGEFHTFVYNGPVFKEPVGFKAGRTVLRDGRFYYHDLIPR